MAYNVVRNTCEALVPRDPYMEANASISQHKTKYLYEISLDMVSQ